MMFFGLSLLTIFMGGTLVLLPGLSRRVESLTHTVLVLAGCGLGLVPAWHALAGQKLSSVLVSWSVPVGRIELGIDSLSGLFLLLHFIVSAAAVLFGSSYFEPYEEERSLKPVRFFISGFIISIALVLAAQNAVLFLVSWEMMALGGFFLVAFEGQELQVRKAALLYLVATHIGTLCLFVAFGLLGMSTGSFAFPQMAGNPALLAVSTPIFVLALLGFGSKAGFVPLHIWLPEAHPAAPSPVSALMSGVMIKTGIYGLLRVLGFFAQPPAWWGFTLGAIGILSGTLGILWALAQSDFKRLLAYSSIENVGIITLGLGIGYLGVSFRNPLIALFGLGGRLVACGQPWFFQKHALFSRGIRAPCDGITRDGQTGRALQKNALHGLGCAHGIHRDLWPAALQRIYQRVADLFRRVSFGVGTGSVPSRGRPGSRLDRGVGGRMLQQSFWRAVSGCGADRERISGEGV